MPRIAYLSWPAAEISGGIKVAFQHVALLNAHGQAAVVATEDGVRPGWFDSGDLPLVRLDSLRPDDVLVFPENHNALLERYGGSRQPKLVFCQNPNYVWRGLGRHLSYADYGVSHVLCVSQTVLRFFELRMPQLARGYTPFYIDTQRFALRTDKALQIACVPRKRQVEAGAVRDLFLALYPQFRDWPWLLIDNAHETKVAQTMGESAVFLSLARLEAHSLTALEAMACGCLVAGFNGVAGGSDSASPANGLWAPEDDIGACAHQLARAAAAATEGGPAQAVLREGGLRTVQALGRAPAAQLLLAFWRQVLPQLA